MSVLKLVAVLLACITLTACGGDTAKVKVPADGTLKDTVAPIEADKGQPDAEGYYLAASNGKFSLYYEETGLTVKVKNNITGEVTLSAAPPIEGSSAAWKNFVNSGIVLEYYKGTAVNLNKTNMYSGKPETKIYLIENGFAAKLNFKSIGISLNMFVTLNDNGIRVQIPNSSIKETKEQYRLAAIYVLPFLGYTRLAETEGYMFIPDGCGAIITLQDNNEKFSQPYKAKVYGGNYSVESNSYAVQKYDEEIATASDTEGIFAPVFGMVHTTNSNAFLGIIEDGKYNAEIYAYPNGVVTEYNWITARYIYREVYQYLTGQSGSITSTQKDKESFDISVCYRFLGGEDADYVGLASTYRDYLTENGVLTKHTEANSGMRLDFFGGDQEKALLGTKTIAMTSVSQIDEILAELTKENITNLSVALKGWQKGGIYGSISEKLSFENNIGDLKEYSKLAEKYSEDASFTLYGDFLNSYKKAGSKNYIYQYNGKIFSNETFLELHPQKFRVKADVVAKTVKGVAEKLGDTKNIGLTFDGITNEAYSYSTGEKMSMFSRKYAAELNGNTLKEAAKTVSTSYIAPNDYLWDSTQKYYDYKLYGSDYKFVTSEIPFFAIVLKGSIPLYSEYVNFKADTTEYKLKLIESGINPSFLLTYEPPSDLIYTDSASLFSCQYSEYKNMIKEYNGIFAELYKATGDGYIIDHSLQNGVAATTYQNGAVVVVNYNDTAAEYNGANIEPMSYLVVNGKAVG